MNKLLENELCVVTGAANGIGRAIAERFLREGADLIVADYDVETAKKVYEGNSHVLDILQVDATKMEDLEKIAESVKKTGREVKAVLPIVGNGPQNPILEITPEEFNLTMNLNVFSAFFTVQKLIPFMSNKSAIVLISSIAGFQGGKNAIVYNAAKAAVRSMARSFTGELAEKGIRANAISPGPTETRGFTEFVKGDDEVRNGLIAQLPIGHIGQPSEIAAVALFLASDESSYVTGAEIITDGGFTNR
ncbi:MAG: SDR family oxidoreductase [Hespellia sp.]|nr:SDR family oxidoreductase [Hespellia sp.]